MCALLGRDGAAASFSPVTVLSLAFEIPFNHVHGIHFMMHNGGWAWSAWMSHTRKTGKLDLGIQGLLPWGLGRYRKKGLGRESREEEWEDNHGLRLVQVPCWHNAEAS